MPKKIVMKCSIRLIPSLEMTRCDAVILTGGINLSGALETTTVLNNEMVISIKLDAQVDNTRCDGFDLPIGEIGLGATLSITQAKSARKSIVLKLAEDIKDVFVIDNVARSPVASVKGASVS